MFSEEQKKTEIYRIIYTGEFNIVRLVTLSDIETYKSYYLNSSHLKNYPDGIINLLVVEDLLLRRRIAEFMISSMDVDKLSAITFHTYRVLALSELIDEFSENLKASYAEFKKESDELAQKVEHKKGGVRSFLHSFALFCDERDHAENPLKSDIWKVDWFNLSSDRDYTKRYNKLLFGSIQNPRNKELIKSYIEYCLRNTGNSIQTIYGRLSALRSVLNMVEKPFDEWNSTDGQVFGEKIKERYKNPKTTASRMAVLFQFTDYLLLNDYIHENPVKGLRDLSRMGTFEYKTTSADHSVVLQIFNVLDLIYDERVVLCFLMIYCVGMRVSEACAIDFDCTEKHEQGTFLKYYSLKMKKDVYNVIPCSLYERIEKYKVLNPRKGFLFPAKKPRNRNVEKPMATSYFYNKINEAMTAGNVTNPDGSQYKFSPHSFRHLIAVKMRERKIPIQFIQEQLHHQSVEMTIQYLEYIDKVKIKKMDEYINIHGDVIGLKKDFLYDEDIEYANYIRKNLNAQILPNGICARPVKLGKCPHGNSCLTCPDFRTSRDNLDAHKEQLKRIECFIAQAKDNGWLPQVETNEILKSNLLSIIRKLEEEAENE